ncbi:MAG: LysR family transcriptional regulator [Geminicoccales bacterium]
MTITLRHLQILSAIAGNRSLTLAAKQLGLSQPSLSQQLSKLESHLSQRLVDRSAKGLHLTDAGRFLLDKADKILSIVEEAEVGLGQFERGTKGELTIGSLTSLARSLLTPASIELKRRFPELQLNIIELSPQSIIERLQSRQIQIALVSSTILANQNAPFTKVDLAIDRYVLAVPRAAMAAKRWACQTEATSTLRSVVMVDFGSPFEELLIGWYRKIAPNYREVARCRTHELALSMVEAGLGIAIVPLLSTQLNGRQVFDIDLFSLPTGPRKILAVLPSQYRYMQPYARVLEVLMDVGKHHAEGVPELQPLFPMMANGKSVEPNLLSV